MKTIVLCNGNAGEGGIVRAMIRYANGIYEHGKYNVEILFKDDFSRSGERLKELNPSIKVHSLNSAKMVDIRNKYRKLRDKSMIAKLVYNLILPYERYIYNKEVKKIFNKRDDILVLIDFDMTLWRYLEKVKAYKIGRFSFSLKFGYEKNPKKKTELIKAYDKLILISKDMIKELNTYYPFAKDKGFHVYNPIDLSKANIDANNNIELTDFEKELIKKPYIVSLCRLNKVKGCHEIIEAVKILRDKGIKINFYMVGDGKEKEHLISLIKKYSLEEQIYILGIKRNPFIWLKNATAFVHASYGEGLPNVLIEAMAVNTPIVAYDCPTGPNDILNAGDCGVLIEMGNIPELSKGIEKIITDKKYCDELKEKMKIRIEDFAVEKSINRMIEMISEFDKG